MVWTNLGSVHIESTLYSNKTVRFESIVQGSQKLYVGNIDFDATKEDLEELFSEYGEVLDVFIPRHKNSGLPRGFAFVTMDQANAENAIEGANGMEFMGRKMIVNKPLPPGERIQRSRTGKSKHVMLASASKLASSNVVLSPSCILSLPFFLSLLLVPTSS